MNPEVMEKVLSCNRLPTLPAVAARVIELTGNNNVSMKALADTIQNDQALAAKVLRTVNSSLYGLRQKCSNINQAIVMLGLSAVKTLALGFTLVGAIKESSSEGFDMAEHWRRALFTATGAKAIAGYARLANPEECFLGGLLQDVGMVALHQTMGRGYTRVIAEARGNHRAIVRLELASFGSQHPDVGAMLASRWKLPDSLVMPVKYHERPTAAPAEHSATCRAVALGNLAADVLVVSQPADALRKFYRAAEQWFGFNQPRADDILRTISQQTREVASLLSVPISAVADARQVLAQARAQLAEMDVIEPPHAASELPTQPGLSAGDPEDTDELTGVATRRRFDKVLIAAFEQAQATSGRLCVAVFAIDGMAEVAQTLGPDARDTVLIAVAGRLERELSSARALVCRFDHERFAVLIPRIDLLAAIRLVEAGRQAISQEPVALIAARAGAPPSVVVSSTVGLVGFDPETADRFPDPASILAVADQALAAARKSGGDSMRIFSPVATAA